jgi:hypothetical protein
MLRPTRPVMIGERSATLPKSRGPRLCVSDRSRRREIRADANALDRLARGNEESCARGRIDGRALWQDRRADITEGYDAVRRRCLGRVIAIAGRTAAQSAHRSGQPRSVVLRHLHQRRGHGLPHEPDAEGNEQDKRTEAGK